MEEAKFQIQDLAPIAIAFVVVTIVIALGLQVTGDIQSDIAANECAGLTTTTSFNTSSGLCYEAANVSNTAAPVSAEYNATADGIEGMGNLSGKLPVIATVVAAAIIIGIIVTYFAFN